MIKKIVYSLILVAILGFTIFGKNGVVELQNYNRQLRDLRAKLSDLQSESREEANSLYGINHSPGYLEKISREDLGLSKQDEVIYVFEEGKEK